MNLKPFKMTLLSAALMQAMTTAYADISTQGITSASGEPIEGWIGTNQAFVIPLLKTEPNQPLNDYQVMAGDSDVTALFQLTTDSLVYSGDMPLPPGEHQLTVSIQSGEEWQMAGEQTIQVLSRNGFQKTEWTRSLDINIQSQLDEKVSGDTEPSERPTYSDVTMALGLGSMHEKDDFSIESQFNLLGVSNRTNAIQFGSRFENASKLDISDYIVTVNQGTNQGRHTFQLGHTSYGSNSLVIDGLSRRGLSWQYQDESEFTLSGAILSGSDIVGYHNITGLSQYSDQAINAIGFGMNLLRDSSWQLRMEGTYMDGTRQAQNDFGIGEIASAEQNQALGIKFQTYNEDGTFNADLTIAASDYTNPDDFNLNQGNELVELEEETSIAHNFNFTYQLLSAYPLSEDSYANLTLVGNHSSADPLYQTLTAFVQANVRNRLLGLQYDIASVSGNISHQTSRDNLDNLVNLLTTETESDSASMNIPLPQMFATDEGEAPGWLPNLDYNYQQTHQYALNDPDAGISGFNGGSHLPDQMSKNHGLNLSWSLTDYNLSLQSNYSTQDNRQVGRENDDFSTLQHAVSIDFQQNAYTSWAFSLGKNKQYDQANSNHIYSDSATVSFNWQSESGLGLSINYSLSEDEDINNQSTNTSTSVDLALVKSIDENTWSLPLSGSISLTVNYNDSESIDNLFELFNQFGTTTVQLGINLSLL